MYTPSWLLCRQLVVAWREEFVFSGWHRLLPSTLNLCWSGGMNRLAIWDGQRSPFVFSRVKPSTCPPGGSILSQACLLLGWTRAAKSHYFHLAVFITFWKSGGTLFTDQDVRWILYRFWLLSSYRSLRVALCLSVPWWFGRLESFLFNPFAGAQSVNKSWVWEK